MSAAGARTQGVIILMHPDPIDRRVAPNAVVLPPYAGRISIPLIECSGDRLVSQTVND